MYAGGGALGDALAVQLADPDGDNIWEGVGAFPPSGGNYVFLNAPTGGGDWGTKEVYEIILRGEYFLLSGSILF